MENHLPEKINEQSIFYTWFSYFTQNLGKDDVRRFVKNQNKAIWLAAGKSILDPIDFLEIKIKPSDWLLKIDRKIISI